MTQESSVGLPSESEAKVEGPSGTSANAVPESGSVNSSDTNAPMLREEALAIAWTGIEVLAKRKQANIFVSESTGRVVIELLATGYRPAEGLIPLAKETL